jgi:type I restriction enzyme S subunit
MKSCKTESWRALSLRDCVTFQTGKLNSNAARVNGAYPFFTCSQETYRTDTFSFDTECVLLAGNNANGVYPLKYFKGKFDAYQRTYVICSTDVEKLDNRYLYFALRLKLELLRSISTGAATKFLTLKILDDIRLELPPIQVQRRITSILSAYDDLIGNNTRRITILEEMSSMIYREWFLNFRFPGHGKVKMVESDVGLIPHGWRNVTIGDIATIDRGRSYKGTELVDDGGMPFLNLKCIERGGGFRYDGIKRFDGQYKSTQTAAAGDIVVAVTDMTQERRLVARAARVPRIKEPLSVLSMDLVKVTPRPEAAISKEFLYASLRFSDFGDRVKEHANGVNVLHLNPVRIAEFSVCVAPEPLVQSFSRLAAAIFEMVDVLNLQNANLRRTRDLLLPKLVSGEVSVEQFEADAVAQGV